MLAAFTPAVTAAVPQTSVTSLPSQRHRLPEFRRRQVFTVSQTGQADFMQLQTAISVVPDGSLLLLKPGRFSGGTIDHKSLRIESEVPRAAVLEEPILIQNVGPNQAVYLSGIHMAPGLEVTACDGVVSLDNCGAPPDGVQALVPPLAPNGGWNPCGVGLSRYVIDSCAAVSLVGCDFFGRSGFLASAFPSGTPGEPGLLVVDSSVAIYGGTYSGGDGSDSGFGHPSVTMGGAGAMGS